MDEHELIWAAQAGDISAFNPLVLKYQDLIYRQAYYLLKDDENAQDLTQDVFIKAFQKLDTFRGGSFKAWLLRMVTNAAYDELRRYKRYPLIPLNPANDDDVEIESPGWLTDPGFSPEEIAEQNDFRRALQRCLDKLQPNYRSAVILVDLQELDYEAASEVLGIPMGTLKSRLSRARLYLRDSLHVFYAGDEQKFSRQARYV